jgi:ferredoxin
VASRIRVSNRSAADGAAVSVETSPALSILNALLRSGVSVRHDCGGKAQCGTCRFRALRGASALSPIRPRESQRLAALASETAAGAAIRAVGEYRLACQTHTVGDIDIELAL